MRHKLIYNPHLSVKENADRNKVSVSTIRKFIRLNGIDRRRDNAIILKRSIDKLKKQNPDISIKEMSRLTHKSVNTIKTCLKNQTKLSNIDTEKVSYLDTSKRKFSISSVSESQDEILGSILRLYVEEGVFDCDLTYSKGLFYKRIPQPKLKFDKYPLSDDIIPLDNFINLENGDIKSVVMDLPFVVKGKDVRYKSMMADRFNCFHTIKELYETNEAMLKLAYSKLSKKGILIVKTMDLNLGGKQHWIGNFVQNKAEESGFRMIDMFVLIAKNKVLTTANEIQKSARKFHSYFFVFQKK